jgi:hypothetical protein
MLDTLNPIQPTPKGKRRKMMKYPEGMEDDVAVRPGMPLVGLGSMGKASPQGRCFSPLEREDRREFFVGAQMKKRVERNIGYTSHGRVDLPDLRWQSDHGLGRLDHALTESGGRTELFWWSDRLYADLTVLMLIDLIHVHIGRIL